MQKNSPPLAPRTAQPRAAASDATGSFVATVTKVVTSFRPDTVAASDALLVISPEARPRGRRVTSLAAASRVPVLLPRRTPANGLILAATDLAADCPVLHLAAALAWRLDALLIALHNVAPLSVIPISVVAGQGLVWPERTPIVPDPARAWRSACLKQACDRLPVVPLPSIREEFSVSDAISSEARASGAELIVVGTRQRNWLQRLLSEDVAAQVVDQAECSVLVAPAAGGSSGSERWEESFDRRVWLEGTC